MAAPSASTLVAVTSRQVPAGLDASRVVSRRPVPGETQALCSRALAHHLHQSADGELRQMTDVRHQPIVGDRIHHRHGRRRRRHDALRACSTSAGRVGRSASESTGGRERGRRARPRGRRSPRRRAGDRQRSAVAPASPARRRPSRASVLPTSVTIASPRTRLTRSRSTLMFCRTGAASTMRSAPSASAEVVARLVGRAALARAASTTRLRSIATMRHGRPRRAQRQRQRAADQPEADDGDLLKHAMLNAEC